MRGFTLLEVVMALALGATVMVALFGMYEGVLDASEQIRRHSRSVRGVRIALGVIEDDLRSLSRAPGIGLGVLGEGDGQDTGANGEVVLAMTTTATLDFNAKLPHAGIQIVEYVLEDGGGGRRLVRRERPFAGITGDFDWVEVVLLEGVESFKVGFWSESFNEFSEGWRMNDSASLPQAVRVSIGMGSGAGKGAYDLVTPLSGIGERK